MILSIDHGAAPIGIDEVKSWLRLGAGQEDALVAGLIRSAAGLCEAFIGQLLIVREVTEGMPIASGAMLLAKRPVVAVDSVVGLSAEGVDIALAAGAWSHDIDRDGTARLRIDQPGSAARVRVTYRAGLASDANSVPEAIRQGLIRMAQHLYAARDGADKLGGDREPPAIIAALWQPWRRVGLGR